MAFADVIRTDAVSPPPPPRPPLAPISNCGGGFTADFPANVISNFLPSSFENRDDEERSETVAMDGRGGGGEAGSSGKRRWQRGPERGMGVADGPRGKGMQDIAAPRDTRGRNLHDGAGDVLQSRSPPTTESLGFHV